MPGGQPRHHWLAQLYGRARIEALLRHATSTLDILPILSQRGRLDEDLHLEGSTYYTFTMNLS